MAQSTAFVGNVTAAMQRAFPDLVRHAYLPNEGRKCLSNPTCQEDIICTKPASYSAEGK